MLGFGKSNKERSLFIKRRERRRSKKEAEGEEFRFTFANSLSPCLQSTTKHPPQSLLTMAFAVSTR